MSVIRDTLIFSCGAAVGAVLTWRILDKKFAEDLEEAVDQRIDDIKLEEAEEERKKQSEKIHEVTGERIKYSDIVKETNYDGKEENLEEEKNPTVTPVYEHPEDDDEVAETPYQISEDEFDEENGYSKESLYFYKGNNIVVDDTDTIIEPDDAASALGRDYYKVNGGDYGVVYIRNEKLKTDYEFVVNMGSYPTIQ